MIEELNYLVRMLAVGGALMLLAQIVANDVRVQLKLPMIGMVVGVSAYLINMTPLREAGTSVDPFVDLLSISTPFFVWLFARNLFERPPPQRMMLAVIPVLLLGWIFVNFFEATNLLGFFILHIVLLGLIIDLVRVGLLERDDDLVEQRRPIRLWLPLLFAAQSAIILIIEMAEVMFGFNSRAMPAQLLNGVVIAGLILLAGLAFLRSDHELLLETQDTKGEKDDQPPLDLSPSESVLHEKLTKAMEDGAYRLPGLSITSLSAQLDTPEHRLQALINRRLGYRNFSAFLNRHRIAEARTKLSDKAFVDIPVLTIAMDLGYNSLPTFNRAFRAETGTSPSEYRRLAFSETEGGQAPTITQESVQN